MQLNKVINITGILLIIIVIIAVYINLKEKIAITAPPFFTYIKKGYKDNEEVIRHEECHQRQYEKLGFWRFYGKYFKEQFNGYENSSLEGECYKLEL